MTDRQDRHDEDISKMSQQFKSKTTIEPNLNMNEQSSREPAISECKNNYSSNTTHDRRNKTSMFDENFISNYLPSLNLPEKIVFVIDTASIVGCTPFKAHKNWDLEPLAMFRRAIDIFIALKSGIQPRHEYALAALKYKGASWIGDFTNDRKTFDSYFERLGTDKCAYTEQELYDLGPCFETICENTNMEENFALTEYVSRVILIYARSREIPCFQTGKQFFGRLFGNSHFYLDCLYVHEPPSDANDCQDVYTKLEGLDCNQTSYILEVGRSLAGLDAAMAKLLAHPLQRARQDDSPYTICNPESPQDPRPNAYRLPEYRRIMG